MQRSKAAVSVLPAAPALRRLHSISPAGMRPRVVKPQAEHTLIKAPRSQGPPARRLLSSGACIRSFIDRRSVFGHTPTHIDVRDILKRFPF